MKSRKVINKWTVAVIWLVQTAAVILLNFDWDCYSLGYLDLLCSCSCWKVCMLIAILYFFFILWFYQMTTLTVSLSLLTHYQTASFRLFPNWKSLQMTISDLTKMAESYPDRKKTLWEKEKLLVTSNFSFSHSVFKRLVSQGHQKVSLCGNGLTLYQTTNF